MRTVTTHVDIEDLDAFLADLDGIAQRFDCAIQAFDADYVVGEDHLRAAVERADRAFDRDENVARERAVEILVYAAGRRQITRALRMGVSEGANRAVVVVHSPEGDDESEDDAAEAVRDLLAPASATADAGERGRSSAPAGENADAGANADAPASATEDAGTAASASADALAADRIDREAVRDFFDVSEAELAATDAALADLVRERVALLDVEK